MQAQRAFVASLFTALSLCFAALLARAIVEALLTNQVAQATLSMLIMTGFMIVAGVAVVASRGRMEAFAARRCAACGSLVYATRRSQDRRAVLTCFTCGHETVVS